MKREKKHLISKETCICIQSGEEGEGSVQAGDALHELDWCLNQVLKTIIMIVGSDRSSSHCVASQLSATTASSVRYYSINATQSTSSQQKKKGINVAIIITITEEHRNHNHRDRDHHNENHHEDQLESIVILIIVVIVIIIMISLGASLSQ